VRGLCELFGVSANVPVSIRFMWRGIVRRGLIHRDGWGVAFYPDGRAASIIKEPRPSPESPIASFLQRQDFVRSKIIISHVRRKSKGEHSHRNTHPFRRELFGREWCFAHNGTILGDLPKPRFYAPIGETDSERAFCIIMDRLRELGEGAGLEAVYRVIERSAQEFSSLGGFNFLMSDGERLYAFWSGHSQLHYVVRAPPHERRVSLIDEDFEVDLSEIKGPEEVATLIATKPLTNERWIRFPQRRLLIFEDGILKLDKLSWKIIKFIRQQPRRVSIRRISEELGAETEEIAKRIGKLRCLNIVRQDRRDVVEPEHPEATYFTEPRAREAIDAMLRWLNTQPQQSQTRTLI